MDAALVRFMIQKISLTCAFERFVSSSLLAHQMHGCN